METWEKGVGCMGMGCETNGNGVWYKSLEGAGGAAMQDWVREMSPEMSSSDVMKTPMTGCNVPQCC